MKLKIFVFSILVFSLICTSAYAVGVAPARETLDFEPNLEKEMTYYVLNKGTSDIWVDVTPEGELKEYMELEPLHVRIPAKGFKTFQYTLKLPATLEPGTREGSIKVITSTPSGEMSGVSARLAVLSQLRIIVPYPGHYVSPIISVKDVAVDEPMDVKLKLDNRGTETSVVGATVKIFDSNENLISTLPGGTISIASRDVEELSLAWEGTAKAGIYTARGLISFHGKTKNDTKAFHVGTKDIEILDSSNTKRNGSIILENGTATELGINIRSIWNEDIKDLHGVIKVIDLGGRTVYTRQTASVNLKSWEIKNINTFIDTRTIGIGKYTLKVTIYFEDQTKTKEFSLRIIEAEAESSITWDWAPYAALILVFAGFIGIMAFMFKKLL